jgi:hypothetical protein
LVRPPQKKKEKKNARSQKPTLPKWGPNFYNIHTIEFMDELHE